MATRDPKKHRDYQREYMRKYRKRPAAQAKSREYSRTHSKRRVANVQRWKAERKQKLIERDGPICGICGQYLMIEEAQFDHIIPRSRGGSNKPENLQLAHPPCNQKKHNHFRGPNRSEAI